MTKRRFKRPASPDEIAAMQRERREREADIIHLRSQPDVQIAEVPRAPHFRIDVFTFLHCRKALPDLSLHAVRRLEADMIDWHGVGADHGLTARVQGSSPRSLLTDRQLMAAQRVEAALQAVGGAERRILEGLLLPQFSGATRVDWRAVVQGVTHEHRHECQAALLRLACGNLASAYAFLDYQPRKWG